jgi:adenylylsulfate kinase
MITRSSFSSGLLIQLTGMSGSGKSTLAKHTRDKLIEEGYRVEVIDGDLYRSILCEDLGFSQIDRKKSINRLSFVGKVLSRNGVITIMSVINPYEGLREKIKNENAYARTVYVCCGIKELIRRDVKGLYAKAILPSGHPDRIENFTGISSPYEEPKSPDLILNTETKTQDECVEKLLTYILKEVE